MTLRLQDQYEGLCVGQTGWPGIGLRWSTRSRGRARHLPFTTKEFVTNVDQDEAGTTGALASRVGAFTLVQGEDNWQLTAGWSGFESRTASPLSE